jgi:heat shock protein HtpX
MALGTVGLQTAIWNNNLRSLALIALYPLVLGGIVWAVAVLVGASMGYGVAGMHGQPVMWDHAMRFGTAVIVQYWPTILAVVAVWFTISLFFHTQMIRLLSHARPVQRSEEPQLYNLLENLCISRGLTMPHLQIVETDARNAFASGISKGNYSITVTRGLMNALRPDELEAVLAHELTHIINNDSRMMVVAIIFIGMLGFAAQVTWSQIRYNLYYRRRSRGDRDAGWQFMILLLAIELVLWAGYLITVLMRLALSRHRESMADEGAVALTKNPEAMMRALLRIEGHSHMPQASPDIHQMCIDNGRGFFLGLLDDHPPISERVAAISRLTGVPVPSLVEAGDISSGEDAPSERRYNPWR